MAGFPWMAGGLALLLIGCAGRAPPRSQPAVAGVPAAWSGSAPAAAGQATSLEQWWARFDDPLLSSLVVQVLQTNPSVKSAYAAWQQALAQRDVAAAGLLPLVSASASAQRSRSGGNQAANRFGVGLDASWDPDLSGARQRALEASEATARASAANLGQTQVLVAAEAGLAYITLRGAQVRLVIANSNLASQLETLQITQWRQQAGLVTALEAEQAGAAAEQTRSQVPLLQTSIEQTSHALAVLMGRNPAALSVLLAATSPVPQPPADLALSLPAETLRQRADVRAAEHQVSAAVALVSQAEAARAPSFNLQGSVGLNALALGTLASGASVASALVASLAVPVFNGGALRAQVRSQQAALEQARMAWQATVLTALQEVEDALIALRSDRERLLSLQRAAAAAGNAALMARQRYSSGLVDFQTVLETQRTQLSTQDSVASASVNLSSDHVRLYKALGGGWRPDDTDRPSGPARTPYEVLAP